MEEPELETERTSIYWDGAFTSNDQDEPYQELVSALSDRAWPLLLHLCEAQPNHLYSVIEAKHAEGHRWSTILHEILRRSAPDDVVDQMLALGALCSVRDERALLPWQVASKFGRRDCARKLRLQVPKRSLDDMRTECVLHGLIRSYLLVAATNVPPHGRVRLPKVIALREKPELTMWFPIVGMMGGFHFWWKSRDAEDYTLLVKAWSRMDGVVQQWRVTPDVATPISEP